jgi:hypothetical protein
MREIKFRAWNTSNKCMIIDSPISMSSIIRDKVRMQYNINGELIGKEYIAMQFTGAIDSSGADIYEDDIVEIIVGTANLRKIYRQVKWCNEKNGFICCTGTIRGNIHENPELLETKCV